MNGRLVFAVPFALSLCLSAATVGGSVSWQDSGFFLCAVKEMGVLHPPGFVLYLLLCKAWTLLFFFLDFTLAVHLFSAFCAALAAGTLAIAARDLLRSRGPVFRVTEEDPGPTADVAAATMGCLAASGYTFWASALYAKTYALFTLVLALLLWRMIRADESRKGRDFTIVAALIGLAWAAHPSATNAGLALALFVVYHWHTTGGKGVAWRAGIAAACALGPSLLLPVLAARKPGLMLGDPASMGEFLRYLRGARFTDVPGVFGFADSRWENAWLYLWQELLVVGALAVAIGLGRIALSNRRLLLGIVAWVLPVVLVAVFFKIEGQLDFWLVSAWLPLHLAAAVGLHEAVRRVPRRPGLVLAGAGLVGVACAAAVNGPLLRQRGDDLPAAFGRTFLQNLDRDAILVVSSDDAVAICSWLQIVKGERPDVLLVNASRAEGPPADGRPIFFENPPPLGRVGKDRVLVPAGALMKLEAGGAVLDPRYWRFPVEMEQLRGRDRRSRGQWVERTPQDVFVEPEAYERRLVRVLARARRQRAIWQIGTRTPEGLREGAALLQSIVDADAEEGGRLEVVYPLGAAYFNLNQHDRARPLLEQALRLAPPPRMEVGAAYYLSKILKKQGRAQEADRYRLRALILMQSDPALTSEFEEFTKPK